MGILLKAKAPTSPGESTMGDTMNFGRFLSDTARLHPEREALVWREHSYTWRELEARVNALAQGLKVLGVGRGDAVLLHSRNNARMVEAIWAVFKLGAVLAPTNFRLTPPEIAYLAGLVKARAFIYDAPFAPHVDAARKAAPMLEHVVAMENARKGEHDYEAVLSSHAGAGPWEASVNRDDPLWYFFTSGTTGRSKAAVLSHGQMAYVVTNYLADLMPGLSHEDASIVVAPLSHGAGLHMMVNTARGAKTVLMPGEALDVEEAWRLMEAHRVSNLFTVPTIVKMLVEHPAREKCDHGALRWVIYAGAPMYREDQKTALATLGPVLVQYYGMGEVTGNITVLPPWMHSGEDDAMPLGSCGYPRTGMEIAIHDPDFSEGKGFLPTGEQGEVCVRGLGVFTGYLDNPEANAASLRDGWFRTGDLGYLDEQGLLYLTGRASDMYISGGANVYPREIEEVLLEHEAVSEAAVLGVPDPKWGEAGVAVVVPRQASNPGSEGGANGVGEAELLGYLEGRLAKYKWPRRIFMWEALPKSGYGKVPKHLIRQTLFDRGDLAEGEPVG